MPEVRTINKTSVLGSSNEGNALSIELIAGRYAHKVNTLTVELEKDF